MELPPTLHALCQLRTAPFLIGHNVPKWYMHGACATRGVAFHRRPQSNEGNARRHFSRFSSTQTFHSKPGPLWQAPDCRVFFKRLDYRPKSKTQESPVLEDASFISVTCLAPETLARSAPWLPSPVQGGGRAGHAGTSSGAPATVPA